MSAVDTAANAIGDALDNGYLRLYSARKELLAELRLAADAFPPADKGRIVANPIRDSFAVGTGDATWASLADASGAPYLDGRVGQEVALRDSSLQDGAVVRCKSLSVTVK